MGAIPGSTLFTFTFTITDHTRGPFSLAALLQTGSATGVTVAPASGYGTLGANCAFFSIQCVTAGAGKLYYGDKNIANDGSRAGAFMQTGDTYSQPIGAPTTNNIVLADHFVFCDTDNTKANVTIRFI